MTPIDAASSDVAPTEETADDATGAHVAPGGDEPRRPPASSSVPRAVEIVQRVGVVVAAAAALVAAYIWFAPLTVPANGGLPFGCGSPAHPNDQQLGGVVCGTSIGTHRAAAAVAFAVAVLAVVVVVALRPLARHRWSAPVALGVLAGAPLLGAALLALVTEVEVRSSDGASVFNCGSALRPVQEAFARGICADVPGSRLAAGIALAAGGLLAIGAVPFVWRPTDLAPDHAPDHEPGPGPGPGPEPAA